ncbi:tape measure protein [Prolixibacter denitrificans]|uniref:Tape measure domain-containing protein n=1 Tax=Prolixibacter denitrificans TaxID=1541063 RepID=A0A2P8CJV6_9BACT|nr:tape measure protein [Prolixibacter denitrificans]PSK85256.1 tape measure domain-containing protein [Prolixibacter denitrificans]GET19878.1 hypothetical protein JCM18694_01240 [Prolixibacter denitrificans]
MSDTGALYFVVDLDVRKLYADIENVNKKIEKMADNSIAQGKRMDDTFRAVGGAIAGYFSLRSMAEFAKQVGSVRGEFEQLDISLQTMLKSKDKADRLMQQVTQFAATTPFELKDISKGTKQLLAFQVGANDIIPTLTELGDLASGLNTPLSELISAYGKVKAKGKLQAEEMNMFLERGIPLVSELAKKYGVAESAIYTMASQSKISFQDLQDVLHKLTADGGMFAGMMEKQSHSILGMVSNLQDSWDLMLNNMGKANQGMIYDTIGFAQTLVANYQSIIDIIKVLIATAGAYKAAEIVAGLIEQAQAAGSLAKALKETAIAQKTLNLLQKASPIGLVVGAFTALITSLALFGKEADKTTEKIDQIKQSAKDAAGEGIDKEIANIDVLLGKLKNVNNQSGDRAKVINTINSQYGSYLKNLLTEKTAYQDIEKALINVKNQLKEKIELEALSQQATSLYKNVRKYQSLIDEVSKMSVDKFNKEFVGKNKDLIKDVMGKYAVGGSIVEGVQGAFRQQFIDNIQYILKRFKDEYNKIIKDINDRTSGKGNGGGGGGGVPGFDEDKFKAQLKAAKKDYQDYASLISEESRKQYVADSKYVTEGKKTFEDYLKDLYEKAKTIGEKIQIEIFAAGEGIKLNSSPIPKKLTPKTGSQLSGGLSNTKQGLETQKLLSQANLKVEKQITEEKKRQQKIFEKNMQTLDNMLYATGHLVAKYSQQLGLTEDQSKVLQDGLNAMSGIADIARGDVLGGSIKIIDSMLSQFLKANEAISVHYENVQKNIEKLVNSVNIANEALANIGSRNIRQNLALINSQISSLTKEAANLAKQLDGQYSGRRNYTGNSGSTAVSYYGIVRDEVASLEESIKTLSSRLLSESISDDQRKAIEAILQSYNELKAQMDSMTQDITGTTVQDLADSIAQAFIDGTDAAESWGKAVDNIIRKVIIDQLTAKLLTKPIQDAIDQLVSDTQGGLTTQEADKFKQSIQNIADQVGPAFEQAQQALADIGINISSTADAASGLAGQVSRSITEDTASELVGLWNRTALDTRAIRDNSKLAITHLAKIEANTGTIARNSDYLKKLDSIDSRLAKLSTSGSRI